MSSNIGVFREGEIDGKPFRIFTFPSQINIPLSSSSYDEESQYCSSDASSIPISSPSSSEASQYYSTYSSSTEISSSSSDEASQCYSSDSSSASDSGDDNDLPLQPLFFCRDSRKNAHRLRDFGDDVCKLPLLPLFWCNNRESNADESLLNCYECRSPELGTDYYLCATCLKMSHKECVESPHEIKHPSYPFTSFTNYISYDSIYRPWRCIICEDTIYNLFYHSPTYNLYMHPACAMKPIPIFIDHPKRHPHSLTFFPKQKSLACNVCGVIKELIPTYVCARCVFVVHQDCIYFPYVIRISRHGHRISFTASLPSGRLSCGVCRRKVDNDYGAYSCNKCDDYFVHSRCALRDDLWDGEELEEVPEEPEIVVEPFETVADGIILHFSHGHNLKLETSRVFDEDKFCQACVLPIYEGNYYSCVDHCDFILHEACANSPLKKHHPLHAHSLTLKVVTNDYNNGYGYGYFRCNACRGEGCGFVYEDPTNDFRLDLRCASVSEPFKYGGHVHPLFLALTPEEEQSAKCQICGNMGPTSYCCRKLNCIECKYIICFKCATLPYKARYKHDKHFLTFRKPKEASSRSGWCEVCERKIVVYARKRGFYACDDCCITLHVHCLLGTDPYMKPGQTIQMSGEEVQILRNNTMSRPYCYGDDCYNKTFDRCLYKVVFDMDNRTFCSKFCLI